MGRNPIGQQNHGDIRAWRYGKFMKSPICKKSRVIGELFACTVFAYCKGNFDIFEFTATKSYGYEMGA